MWLITIIISTKMVGACDVIRHYKLPAQPAIVGINSGIKPKCGPPILEGLEETSHGKMM